MFCDSYVLTVSVWPFSSPGLTSWHLVRSTWRTSGPQWRQRWLSRWPSPLASPSPGLTPPSLPPSSHHSWEELWSSTPRKTRAWTCSQYLVRPPAGDWGQGTVLWSLEHCSQTTWVVKRGPRPPRELSGKIVTTCDKTPWRVRVLKSCQPHCLGLTHRTCQASGMPCTEQWEPCEKHWGQGSSPEILTDRRGAGRLAQQVFQPVLQVLYAYMLRSPQVLLWECWFPTAWVWFLAVPHLFIALSSVVEFTDLEGEG